MCHYSRQGFRFGGYYHYIIMFGLARADLVVGRNDPVVGLCLVVDRSAVLFVVQIPDGGDEAPSLISIVIRIHSHDF